MRNVLSKQRLEARRQRVLEKTHSFKKGVLVPELAKAKSPVSQRKEIMGGIRKKYAGGVKQPTGMSKQTEVVSRKQSLSFAKPTIEDINKRRQLEKINNNRTCIINQSGLSEILFCEPIARLYYDDGYKVVWPTETKLLNNINKHFPHITFIDKSLINVNYEDRWFRNTDDALYAPLQWAGDIAHDDPQSMVSKYTLYNLPIETWKTAFWKRDTKSEQELFFDILQLELDEPYNLISNKYKKDFGGTVDIKINNGLRNIFVEVISDYTLIDWSMVIENASNIYTIESAINYIIELTDIRAKDYHLIPRATTRLFAKPKIVREGQ